MNYETNKVLEILELDKNLKTCLKQASSVEIVKPVLWTILGNFYNWDSISLSQIDCKTIYKNTR